MRNSDSLQVDELIHALVQATQKNECAALYERMYSAGLEKEEANKEGSFYLQRCSDYYDHPANIFWSHISFSPGFSPVKRFMNRRHK